MLLLVCLCMCLVGSSAGFRQLLQQQNYDKLNTTMCVWDGQIEQCKANPLVKKYLLAHSFEEQQIIGASQCVVEDNPGDCNVLPGCVYNEDIDGNYNNIYDRPDRQMCVQSTGDVTTLQDFAEQYDMSLLQTTLKKCFKPDSYWYIIFDCQSRSVCEGVCGEPDPYLDGICSVDLDMMSSTQRAMFLNSSLVLMGAIEQGDQDTLKQLAIRDISQNASYFCTSVFPVIFPCLGGLMGSDNAAPDCYLGNPAKFYWRDQAYLHLFDQSQKCYQNDLLSCETLKVFANWNVDKQEKYQKLTANSVDRDGNFSVKMEVSFFTFFPALLLFVVLYLV